MIPTGMIMSILYLLYRLFKKYSQGEIFDGRNVVRIKNIGYFILAYNLSSPLYEGLVTYALTYQNEVGHKMIRMGLSGMNLFSIAIAVMIIIIAWIMDEGRKLKENEAYTI